MSQIPDALRYILWRYSQDHTGEDHQARVAEAQAWLATTVPVPIDDIERILREHDLVYGYKAESNLLVRRVQRWLDALQRQDYANPKG